MVKIRLRRMGAKKNPYYRIVVADSRSPRDGRCIEEIGTFDPQKETQAVTVNKERVEYWLSKGAQPTDTVRALLKKEGAPVKQKVLTKSKLQQELKAKNAKAAEEAKEAAEKAAKEKAAEPKAEEPAAPEAKEEAPPAKAPVTEEPKAEEPKAEEPAPEEPVAEEPKAEEAKEETPAEEPATQEVKTEEPGDE